MIDLTTAAPVEFDTALAAVYAHREGARRAADIAYMAVVRTANSILGLGGYGKPDASRAAIRDLLTEADETSSRTHYHNRLLTAWERYEAAQDTIDEDGLTIAEFNDAFRARGGWTRAFLVTNQGGHVHRSMDCGTCYATTQYHWLTEVSGHDEAEIVDKAASRACTVCYPTAPVDKPSVFLTPDERTAAEKRDNAAKARAERSAKQVANGLTADGSEFQVTYIDNGQERRERFKTERAAVQWVVQYRAWATYYPQRDDERADAYRQVIAAVAAKHGQTVEDVETQIDAKVAAKIRRDR